MTCNNTRGFVSKHESIDEGISEASHCLLFSPHPEENVAVGKKADIRLADLVFISPLICKQGQGCFPSPTINILRMDLHHQDSAFVALHDARRTQTLRYTPSQSQYFWCAMSFCMAQVRPKRID